MDETHRRIENVFRSSSSSDELFDSFSEAINIPITDINIYKMLLANPALSNDEIKMFSEKLIKEFPQNAFDILMWIGKLFEHQKNVYNKIEDSLRCYMRAFSFNPLDDIPLLNLLNLFDYDLDNPGNKTILDFVESSVVSVNKKSRVYNALSAHYNRQGKIQMAARYLALAEKAAERE